MPIGGDSVGCGGRRVDEQATVYVCDAPPPGRALSEATGLACQRPATEPERRQAQLAQRRSCLGMPSQSTEALRCMRPMPKGGNLRAGKAFSAAPVPMRSR
jgi:hypothetical protein